MTLSADVQTDLRRILGSGSWPRVILCTPFVLVWAVLATIRLAGRCSGSLYGMTRDAQ